jgi:hypothetical protein
MARINLVSPSVVSMLLGGSLLASTLTACSKESEERPPQTGQYVPSNSMGNGGQQGYAGQGGQGYAGQATAAAGAAGAGQLGPVTGDPTALQNLIAGALAGGVAALSGMTGGELGPIQAGINNKAKTAAVGMKPDGQLLSAKLAPGGHAEGTFTLQPGSCYTVIGFGGFGVFEYQLNLLSAPPLPPQVLAQSNVGVDPVVGAGDQCIRNPTPAPMTVKIDMNILRGQGLVGAQVYKK